MKGPHLVRFEIDITLILAIRIRYDEILYLVFPLLVGKCCIDYI